MGWAFLTAWFAFWEWLALRGRHEPLSFYVRKAPRPLLWSVWLFWWSHFLRRRTL